MRPDSTHDLGSDLPSTEEVASLIRKIDEQAAKKEERWKKSRPPRRQFGFALVVLTFLIFLNGYLWIAHPTWLMGDRGRPTTPEGRAEVLRNKMYVQAQRIWAFRREAGRVPTDLAETGTPVAGLVYTVTGPDSWELLGESDGRDIVIRSSDRGDFFLQGL
jgi:hypothetical protein